MSDTDNASFRKLLSVLFVGALGASVVGFLVGTRPAAVQPESHIPGPTPSVSNAVPGQTYRELRSRRFGPNAFVRSNLHDLNAELPKPTDPVVQTEEQRSAALDERAARRAYGGAPPMIPHVIDEQATAGCLACHESGIRVGGRIAPVISHPPFANCTQCHAPSLERWSPAAPVHNAFAGQFPPSRGARAWPGAPPSIPHDTFMRDDCASCHGVAGAPGLRTTHPDRQNCTQCHAPSISAEPWGSSP